MSDILKAFYFVSIVIWIIGIFILCTYGEISIFTVGCIAVFILGLGYALSKEEDE